MNENKYIAPGPSKAEVDAFKDLTLLEFGTDWCGICMGAQALIKEALGILPKLDHIKIEDGPGRKLGRSFRVKLWPTLIFLKDGLEVARVVRPQSLKDILDIKDALTI